MQVSIKLDRKGTPSIKAKVDMSTGDLVVYLALPVKASAQEVADIATVLSGDSPVQLVLSNPQMKLDELFQNTEPGINR